MSILGSKRVAQDVMQADRAVPRGRHQVLARVRPELYRLNAVRGHAFQLELVGTLVGRHQSHRSLHSTQPITSLGQTLRQIFAQFNTFLRAKFKI